MQYFVSGTAFCPFSATLPVKRCAIFLIAVPCAVATPDEPPVVSRHFNNIMPAMNREQTTRCAQHFNRGLSAAAIALCAALAGSPLAHAASFRCPHDASASERLVCNDPTLSALDDQLAALYHKAFDATTDSAALEADRVSQWQWRQHNCKDKACVTDWYDRRIAELEADLKHGKQASAQRVKEGVVDQQLAPSAQDAVLEMKGIAAVPKSPDSAPASSAEGAKGVAKTGAKLASAEANAPLHLKKMPSGVAADARQKRLAEVHAHRVPGEDAALSTQADASAMAAKMAGANSAFAKAAGMASIDAPLAQPASSAANSAAELTSAQALTHQAAQANAQADGQAKAQTQPQPGANAATCADVASAEPARAADSPGQQGAVALK